jgi:hypothetical protein
MQHGIPFQDPLFGLRVGRGKVGIFDFLSYFDARNEDSIENGGRINFGKNHFVWVRFQISVALDLTKKKSIKSTKVGLKSPPKVIKPRLH